MPRHARPRYHKGRGRWYACLGRFARDGRRREVFAPAEIADEAAAWFWFLRELAARGLESPYTTTHNSEPQ